MSVHTRRLRPFRPGDHTSADRHAHRHADRALTIAATQRPTATPAPYTPAPTATPTITPTPIVYRIQRGDNLMKIAGQFGISVRSLQDTNGITDPACAAGRPGAADPRRGG